MDFGISLKTLHLVLPAVDSQSEGANVPATAAFIAWIAVQLVKLRGARCVWNPARLVSPTVSQRREIFQIFSTVICHWSCILIVVAVVLPLSLSCRHSR